uniref:Uncharacterized protein n=1 Tax=Trichobilharzia regenti TaxID=157069 RepID=A0AA85KLX5_TRIRE|nr:unnamed protein product [Trichobilharzia regenti]
MVSFFTASEGGGGEGVAFLLQSTPPTGLSGLIPAKRGPFVRQSSDHMHGRWTFYSSNHRLTKRSHSGSRIPGLLDESRSEFKSPLFSWHTTTLLVDMISS